MTSIKGRVWPAWRGQASEAPSGPFSSNKDHEDSLGSNKPRSSKAPAGSEAPAGPETLAGPETPPEPPQAPLLPIFQDLGANYYSQQDLNKILKTFFHTSKGGSGDKLKAKTPAVYRSWS